MENVIKRKSQSEYLSLIVKKICQDRLNSKELEAYKLLKNSIDPLGNLEKELTMAWEVAESQQIADSVKTDFINNGRKTFSFKNFFQRAKSIWE